MLTSNSKIALITLSCLSRSSLLVQAVLSHLERCLAEHSRADHCKTLKALQHRNSLVDKKKRQLTEPAL